MRELRMAELEVVSGAGGDYGETCDPKNQRGNNGWGNGGDDGIPGNSAKVDDGFKVSGDSTGGAGITGGGRDKVAR
jgi:hypothetical protein